MLPHHRLLQAAPPSWCAPDVVPPSLADALAAAMLDEAACTRLPGLRAAAAPLVALLRPSAAQALDRAGGVGVALEAAATVVGGLAALAADRQRYAGAWMSDLTAALPALGFQAGSVGGDVAGDARLLGAALQGLALAAAAASEGAGAGEPPVPLQAVADAVLALLAHPVAAVADAAHSLLPELLTPSTGAAAGQARTAAAMQLLTLPPVLEQLVVAGLGDARRRGAAAAALVALLREGGSAAAGALLSWQAWVECHSEEDAAVAPLAAALEAARECTVAVGRAEGRLGWHALAPPLRRLFARQRGARQSAARQLLLLMDGALPAAESEGQCQGEDEQDPLRGLLEGAPPPEPLFAAAPQMVANFRAADVFNLLAVLHNARWVWQPPFCYCRCG